jgi:hypothetical protein
MRIVRVASASSRETGLVAHAERRAEGGSAGRRPTERVAAGTVAARERAATPFSADEMASCVGELQDVLQELSQIGIETSGWSCRVLTGNVRLAVADPGTLTDPTNQIDFIEEIAEAVWDGVDCGLRGQFTSSAGADQGPAREARRGKLVEQLEDLADHMLERAQRWQQQHPGSASEAAPDGDWPQPGHTL